MQVHPLDDYTSGIPCSGAVGKNALNGVKTEKEKSLLTSLNQMFGGWRFMSGDKLQLISGFPFFSLLLPECVGEVFYSLCSPEVSDFLTLLALRCKLGYISCPVLEWCLIQVVSPPHTICSWDLFMFLGVSGSTATLTG